MRAPHYGLVALGVAASTPLPWLLPPFGCAVALLCVSVWAFCARRAWRPAGLAIACLLAGLTVGTVQGQRLQASLLPQALEGQSWDWQGCLTDTPTVRWRGHAAEWRFP